MVHELRTLFGWGKKIIKCFCRETVNIYVHSTYCYFRRLMKRPTRGRKVFSFL